MKEPGNGHTEMMLTPVGRVCSELKTPTLKAAGSELESAQGMERWKEHQRRLGKLVSEVVIFPQWGDLLDGIEGFSHVLVLYWPHLIDPARRNLRRVHPMGRKDIPRQGIFATCSPARPNPVLVSAVRLLERRGCTLAVQGLEAVDGSPVIDVKPYSSHYYGAENPAVPEWMARIHWELGGSGDKGPGT